VTPEQRPADPVAERADATGSLSESTARGAKRIFFRFLLVAMGVCALVGGAVVVYNVASSLQETHDRLDEQGSMHAGLVSRLRQSSSGPDRDVVRRAAFLVEVPMALLSREDGSLRFATDEAIPRMLPRVYDERPTMGTRVRITDELGHLSGGWTVRKLSDRHLLLVISPRRPEDEGLALYMTIAAGLTGVGIAIAFFVMLAAANWMLRRPLSRLVEQLTGALARDVQRRKKAEERAVAARDEAEKHLAFMNSLIDASEAVGIVAMDAQGLIQIFNWAAVHILGYHASEVVGHLTLEQIRARRRSEERRGAVSPIVHAREGEELWIDKQGDEHLLAVNSSEIVDSDGNQRGMLVIFIDVTESRKLEAELQLNELQLIQSAKLATLGEMATGIAHELNQPLNNIGLLASRMSRKVAAGASGDDQAMREFFEDRLRKIQAQVERAGKIIDHLRAFGRPRTKQLERVRVQDPVEGVMVFLREQLVRRDISVVIDLPDDLPRVEADEARLEQVLMNLILNARDALEEVSGADKKEVRISAARSTLGDEPRISIQVRDTGHGIPREVIDRVFEPFFSTKEVGKGTGLGLSISYGLVHEFGGTLEVESEPGSGTTFTINLREAAASGGG
jgi:PAS domain S-box-containing protein